MNLEHDKMFVKRQSRLLLTSGKIDNQQLERNLRNLETDILLKIRQLQQLWNSSVFEISKEQKETQKHKESIEEFVHFI